MDTVEFDDTVCLFAAMFDEPTNVVITGTNDFWWRSIGLISNRNIASLRFKTPGIYKTSEDGKFLYGEEPHSGNLMLVGCFGQDEEVVVPDGIFGIYDRAFGENMHVKSVVLPKSIRVIEKTAFIGCKNLEKIYFPEGLWEIGGYAFQGTGLKELTFPASLERIERGAFHQCKKLETVTFANDSKASDLNDIFEGCEKLSKFVFPGCLERINPYCFRGCRSLTEVHLPASVKSLESGTFSDVQDVYLEALPRGLFFSVMSFSNTPVHYKQNTYTIHYKGSNFVFPREIRPSKIPEIEKLMSKKRRKSDIAGIEFAEDPKGQVLTALEAVRRYGVKSAKEFLKEQGQYPLILALLMGQEELMQEILHVYEREGMLTHDFLRMAKSLSIERSWLETTAYVLSLTNESGMSDTSFDL